MSAASLEYPRKPNDLPDDVESFMYVVLLAILRFHPTSLSGNKLGVHVGMVYNISHKTSDDYCVGSGQKLRNMCTGDPGFTLVDSTSNLAYLLAAL